VDGAFQNVCDEWFNGTGGQGATTTWNFDMTQYSSSDWSSLGYSETVSSVGGSAFWFLSGSTTSSTKLTQFNSYTTEFTTNVDITITMKGQPTVFNVNAGYWDVPAFKTLYPTLLANGKDFLTGNVRLDSILLAYEVGLTITFSDVALYEAISTYILDIQKSVSGGLSIFGFHFGGSKTSTYQQTTKSITLTQTSTGGTIVLPPTAQGVTVMLGALGKAL